MEEKNKYGIVLDGRMDEPIWDTVPEYSGFHFFETYGGALQPEPTYFKILPCEDRIYIGFQCMEPEQMDIILENKNHFNSWGSNDMEIFFSPSGNPYEFYQFVVGMVGQKVAFYYAEGGNIQPDPYAPDWKFEVHIGEDFWGAEVEIPLTAFYMTPDNKWTDQWLVNFSRTRCAGRGATYSNWSPLKFSFIEPYNYNTIGGFPKRPACDDIRIASALVNLKSKTDDGYHGDMAVSISVTEAADFEFTSDHGETTVVSLAEGDNQFTVPCFFAELGRTEVMLSIKRLSDGKVFKRYYPVRASYEPLKVKLTLPEYRNNFYPGQDYSKIVGTAIAETPITLTLEGPGIETTTITANADGSFAFDTPNFGIGEAWLTATIDGYEVKKKIRRLAPIEKTMAWIEHGNLVIDGEPVFGRKFYGPHYGGGVAFNRRYDADNMYITPKIKRSCAIQPQDLLRGCESTGGEATFDQYPSDEMLRKIDEAIAKMQGKDFVFYYISDEPECRSVSPVYLQHMYEYIADKDPYHVVMMAIRGAAPYVECADWFQTHPYICPYNEKDGSRTFYRPLHTMGGYIDDIVNLNRPDKCIGFLTTCYAHKGRGMMGYDYPTFDETIAHTWAAIMHGGKSLWPYAYHDLNQPCIYEGHRYVFSTFEALEKIVLFGKRTTLYRGTNAESVLYDNGDEKMFVLVNYTLEPQTITLDGLTGTWYNFRHEGMLTGNTFTLKPMETIIGTNVVKDEGYTSYDEAYAVFEKLEYERTHTGSLLFDRFEDITFTNSGLRWPTLYRLFNGVRDNLGIELASKKDKFIEMDMSKFTPKCEKLVIRGYNMEGMKTFLNGEELQPKEVETEEFAVSMLLPQPVDAEKLRLEFPSEEIVELYQIEMF